MIAALALPHTLREQIAAHARATFPRECCGLLEGVRTGDAIEIVEVHAAPNLAADCDRFELDPAEQFRLMRAARDAGHEIVGCYHSHPNGKAEPSPRDLAGAGEDGFLWFIAALGEAAPVSIRTYVFENGVFRAVPVSVASLAPSGAATL